MATETKKKRGRKKQVKKEVIADNVESTSTETEEKKEVGMSTSSQIKNPTMKVPDEKTNLLEKADEVLSSKVKPLNSPNAILTDEQRDVKKRLLKEPQIVVVLPPTGEPRKIKIDGVTYNSEGTPETYTISGYKYHVPRGIQVKVPLPIAQLISNNKQTELYFKDELRRNFKHSLDSVKELYNN